MYRSFFLLSLLALSRLEGTVAFYYNQYRADAPVHHVMLPQASDLFPALYNERQQNSEHEANGNGYNNPDALWANAQASTTQNLFAQNDEPNQVDSQYYPMSRGMLYGAPPQESADVCASGFVEHCLVQANSDGEQRLMLASMVANRTGATEQETLKSEFDGMCHVVTRFIDCLNTHYFKCSPVGRQVDQQMAKDIFADSWAQLCASNSLVRQSKSPSIIHFPTD